MYSCWCGYMAPCQLQAALHMVLVHLDGEASLLPGYYEPECLRCIYGNLAPYQLVATERGLAGTAAIGPTLLQVPNGRGPQDGLTILHRRKEEL